MWHQVLKSVKTAPCQQLNDRHFFKCQLAAGQRISAQGMRLIQDVKHPAQFSDFGGLCSRLLQFMATRRI